MLISLSLYLGFVIALRSEKGTDYIGRHLFLHPNVICVWRVFVGLGGTLLYFVTGHHFLGILLFMYITGKLES